jgi:hypothetical protein
MIVVIKEVNWLDLVSIEIVWYYSVYLR